MPTPAQQGDKFQVRIVGDIEGTETNNVLHFMAGTPVDDVELRLIQALVECIVTNLLPVTSSSWSLRQLVWQQCAPTLGVQHIYIPPEAGPGGGPAAALPSYCSAVVSIRTAMGGPSKRGRMYLPGIPEAATTISTLDSGNAFWTGLVAFVVCVGTKFILGDVAPANAFQLMVYSRKLGGSQMPYAPNGFQPVTSMHAVQQLGTTRSRKLGVGR